MATVSDLVLPPAAPPAPPPRAHSLFAIDVPRTLLAAVCAGERDAFERLYRLFERPVYTLALRMLGGAPDAAADVLQDTMLKVFRGIGMFRGDGGPFWAWLRQVAVNEALMRLRRDRPTTGQIDLADGPDIEDPAPPPTAAADAAQLQRALAALPPLTRSVLWLYHGEGYTHEEIAVLMQRTPSFSKSQLARGTRRLRALLTDSTEAAHGR